MYSGAVLMVVPAVPPDVSCIQLCTEKFARQTAGYKRLTSNIHHKDGERQDKDMTLGHFHVCTVCTLPTDGTRRTARPTQDRRIYKICICLDSIPKD
jgi:hypothetical protein